MTAPLELCLPWPPSVNHYYGNASVKLKATGKHTVIRYITKIGKQYKHDVKIMVDANGAVSFGNTKVQVLVILHPILGRKKVDIDNYHKALFDALEHACVFNNDHQIRCLGTVMSHPVHGGRVNITIKELQ